MTPSAHQSECQTFPNGSNGLELLEDGFDTLNVVAALDRVTLADKFRNTRDLMPRDPATDNLGGHLLLHNVHETRIEAIGLADECEVGASDGRKLADLKA